MMNDIEKKDFITLRNGLQYFVSRGECSARQNEIHSRLSLLQHSIDELFHSTDELRKTLWRLTVVLIILALLTGADLIAKFATFFKLAP